MPVAFCMSQIRKNLRIIHSFLCRKRHIHSGDSGTCAEMQRKRLIAQDNFLTATRATSLVMQVPKSFCLATANPFQNYSLHSPTDHSMYNIDRSSATLCESTLNSRVNETVNTIVKTVATSTGSSFSLNKHFDPTMCQVSCELESQTRG